MRFTYCFRLFGHQLLNVEEWEILHSWNMVCHRTIATLNLPDFGLIAFADRTWEYFIDVLKVQNDQEIPWEHDDYYSRLEIQAEEEYYLNQQGPWEHDYYSRAEQLADEANADYWDEVARNLG